MIIYTLVGVVTSLLLWWSLCVSCELDELLVMAAISSNIPKHFPRAISLAVGVNDNIKVWGTKLFTNNKICCAFVLCISLKYF